jgi:hypothetical protein
MLSGSKPYRHANPSHATAIHSRLAYHREPPVEYLTPVAGSVTSVQNEPSTPAMRAKTVSQLLVDVEPVREIQ